MDGQVSRRRFLDWFLSTSAGVFLLSAFYPVARYQEKKRLKIGEREASPRISTVWSKVTTKLSNPGGFSQWERPQGSGKTVVSAWLFSGTALALPS